MKKPIKESLKNAIIQKACLLHDSTGNLNNSLTKVFEQSPKALNVFIYNKMKTLFDDLTPKRVTRFLNGETEPATKQFLIALSQATNTPTKFSREKFKAGTKGCTAEEFIELDEYDRKKYPPQLQQ